MNGCDAMNYTTLIKALISVETRLRVLSKGGMTSYQVDWINKTRNIAVKALEEANVYNADTSYHETEVK